MAHAGANSITGEVIFVDHFGNLITNIEGDRIRSQPFILQVGQRTFSRGFRWVRSYAEAEPGALVALVSSSGTLEVAVTQGNAARRLRASIGTRVTIGWASGAAHRRP